MCVSLTSQAWQHTDVSLVQQRQSIMINVKVREVRDKIISYKEAHQNPVIYYSLQIIIRTHATLKNSRKHDNVDSIV